MRSISLHDMLTVMFLRPRKKSMRLDVGMKRLSSPYPRNVHKKPHFPSVPRVTRGLFGDA